MPRLDSSVVTLVIAVGVASAVGAAVTLDPWKSVRDRIMTVKDQVSPASQAKATATPPAAGKATPVPPRAQWTASAPGRVEPKDGEVRIASQTAAQIVEVPVAVNDRVRNGDVLVRLDDTDLLTRLFALEAEVAVRKRERDLETVPKLAIERRQAEDALAAAERAAFRAQFDLDRSNASRRAGKATGSEVETVRDALVKARETVETERENLRRVEAQQGMPLPSRLESALVRARSELSLAESAIERTRVRAPKDGTVLQVNAKRGELAPAGGEMPLATLGNVDTLQVRAEIEERDVAKVRVGQVAIVRTDAYPNRDFTGRVTTLARSLAPPRLSSRGPRRPNDVDVLEAIITLEGDTPLLPGMRADIFFKPDETVQSTKPAEAPRPTN